MRDETIIDSLLPIALSLIGLAFAAFFYFETGQAMKMLARDFMLWVLVIATFSAYVLTGEIWIESLFGAQMFIAIMISILDFIIPVLNFIATVMSKRKVRIGGTD